MRYENRKLFPNSTGREVPIPGNLSIIPPTSPDKRNWFKSTISRNSDKNDLSFRKRFVKKIVTSSIEYIKKSPVGLAVKKWVYKDSKIESTTPRLQSSFPKNESITPRFRMPKLKSPVKKWFPNSTGRDIPMTSRFGIDHNKDCAHLRPPQICLPGNYIVKIVPLSPVTTSVPKAPYKRKGLYKREVWGLNLS